MWLLILRPFLDGLSQLNREMAGQDRPPGTWPPHSYPILYDGLLQMSRSGCDGLDTPVRTPSAAGRFTIALHIYGPNQTCLVHQPHRVAALTMLWGAPSPGMLS